MQPKRGDVEANLCRFQETLRDPIASECDLLVAPEMFLTGFMPAAQRLATRDGGALLKRVSSLVKESGVALATSVLTERGHRQYNTFYLWDGDGTLLGRQDKIHLWAEEAGRATPGDATAPIKTGWGNVGGMVCYDVEFPEVSRALAVAGAEILLCPSAFYSPIGWDVSTRARALENGCYLIAANQVGGDPSHPHNGMTRIVDPFAKVVAEIPPGKEGVIAATLDPDVLANARAAAPFLRDRRLGVPAPTGSAVMGNPRSPRTVRLLNPRSN